MRLPEELNNGAIVAQYFDAFERRFVPAGDSVIYQRVERGGGVKLTPEKAAELIAGMRATLYEVDSGNPLWGPQWVFTAIGAVFTLIILGAIADFLALAGALILPVIVAVLLLGPGLGHLRASAAWRRGLAEVERQIADCPAADDAMLRTHAPANPIRPVFIAVVVLFGAVAAGLFIAADGMPVFERTKLDRLLAGLTWPAVLLIVGLALASYVFDAFQRRRVSEAEIAAALARREGRPLG